MLAAPSASATLKTIRPLAAASLQGLAFTAAGEKTRLLALDSVNGYLLEIDPLTANTQILNKQYWQEFVGATGLALVEGELWFTSGQGVYRCPLDLSSAPQPLLWYDYPVNGLAVWEKTLYLTCQKTGHILIYDRESGKLITRFYSPGIGVENITLKDNELWLTDNLEQSVYCLDRATGDVKLSILTPFENPTGLAFAPDGALYVAYVQQEPYIRDNPNADPNHELHYRSRAFIHPLNFYRDTEGKYVLSNGFLVEMTYVEELAPLDPVELPEVEWRIALPAETPRQRILSIEPIGAAFQEIQEEAGQKLAVFKFDALAFESRAIFGWRVVLEMWGIKYQLQPKDCEGIPPLPAGFAERYLVDDDDLSMDSEIIQRAAKEAVARETNILRRVHSIRNYVYDRLSYGIKPHIDTPDLALRRGVGSCGEYVGVLLALTRLNGIACRTAGRYKCPPQPLTRNLPLEPDFNHVWLEFYVPGFGWLPMESNPDDIQEGGPYPNRFFMGLAWYHAEMAKEITFERFLSAGEAVDKQQVSIGELAINHVQFVILDELLPGAGAAANV
ncbi:MAG: transglutaminase domain-containing protein [Cyanobacteriota bacterium]|nr:transglutaminase domain-containing protein [Cyanobacteriota bacterium]